MLLLYQLLLPCCNSWLLHRQQVGVVGAPQYKLLQRGWGRMEARLHVAAQNANGDVLKAAAPAQQHINLKSRHVHRRPCSLAKCGPQHPNLAYRLSVLHQMRWSRAWQLQRRAALCMRRKRVDDGVGMDDAHTIHFGQGLAHLLRTV